ncbi:MAG: hypothetical protein J7K81_04660 [Methanophagales archaeon]|nr:hypothetical protein [Methanophagales archaeon]
MDVEKQGMTNNRFNYTLSPEDFMVSSIWSLPIHGRAALGGKIFCATTIATSLKNTVVLLHGPIGCAYQRRMRLLVVYQHQLKFTSSRYTFHLSLHKS